MKIDIMIVDDHPMIIDGLKNMLREYEHISLIGAYNDGEALLEGLTDRQPHVLLLDIQLPGKPGDELVPIILKQYPGIGILALTNYNSSLYISTMFRQGALGYLLKTTQQHTLIEAIETVYRKETYTEPSLRAKLQQEGQRNRNIYPRLSLTIREKEIIKLLAAGKSNQEIAETLFIGFNTVRNYRARIFAKLDVNTISELVKKVLTLGLNE
jgi:DNA-binding NarL/FixJ family response regulator